jgi:hypothetical protein
MFNQLGVALTNTVFTSSGKFDKTLYNELQNSKVIGNNRELVSLKFVKLRLYSLHFIFFVTYKWTQ